jgi:hypothetical protein
MAVSTRSSPPRTVTEALKFMLDRVSPLLPPQLRCEPTCHAVLHRASGQRIAKRRLDVDKPRNLR